MFGDPGLDPSLLELAATLAAIIDTVRQQLVEFELAPRTDSRDAVDNLDHLGDVVAVFSLQRASERDAVGADDQVMFAAFTAEGDRRGRGFLPPLALTCGPSTTALD